MITKLVNKGWLYRKLETSIKDKTLEIEYSGKGLGSEMLAVNGNEIKLLSAGIWYIPKFDVDFDGCSVKVEIRVWPWLALRSFVVSVDDKTIYREGQKLYEISRLSEIFQAIGCYIILISVIGSVSMMVSIVASTFS